MRLCCGERNRISCISLNDVEFLVNVLVKLFDDQISVLGKVFVSAFSCLFRFFMVIIKNLIQLAVIVFHSLAG